MSKGLKSLVQKNGWDLRGLQGTNPGPRIGNGEEAFDAWKILVQRPGRLATERYVFLVPFTCVNLALLAPPECIMGFEVEASEASYNSSVRCNPRMRAVRSMFMSRLMTSWGDATHPRAATPKSLDARP